MSAKKVQIKSDLWAAGQIFKTDFKYKVPPPQRNFSWTHDEVEQLWVDINEAMDEGRGEYFLGTIVVQENRDDKTRTIIDGQQRLVTLTMILSGIRSVYKDYEDDRSDEVYQEFLGSRDRRSRTFESRLTLNEVNEASFQKLVINEATDDELKKAAGDKTELRSNQLLSKAAKYLRESVSNRCKPQKSFENYLIALEEFIRDSVMMIVVLVDDEADAYLIFETLNDRGLELSMSDLLKNYIFGKAGSDLEAVRIKWIQIVTILSSQSETQFLRHYWLSRYGVVRERDLFKEMKSKFTNKNSVLTLMSELGGAANNYAAISNVDHDIWSGYPSQARKDLETLQLFGLKQFRPLLMTALDMLATKEIVKLLRIIVVVSMRYSIIGSLGTGNIEKAYSDAAISISNNKARSAKQVFEMLSGIYPDSNRFYDDFTEKSIGNSKLARFIITAIANDIQGSGELEVLDDETKVTLEHIMPKTRSEHWLDAAESEDEYSDYVNRLGNMALLEKTKNRGIGNASFSDKKKIFAESDIVITNNLMGLDSWTVSEIANRQEAFANSAIKVWSVQY